MNQHQSPDSAVSQRPALRLEFERGISPSKWERRWREAFPGQVLELVPLELPTTNRGSAAGPLHTPEASVGDEHVVRLERHFFGARPNPDVWHSVRLYEEQVTLAVSTDHELSSATEARSDDLALVPLIDHPNHDPAWPDPQPWADPSYAPATVKEALELAATGLGGVLLPASLGRHLARKDLSFIAVPDLPETAIWAVWHIEHDTDAIQDLIGILRGRKRGSSRNAQAPAPAPQQKSRGTQAKRPAGGKKRGAPTGSRRGRRR